MTKMTIVEVDKKFVSIDVKNDDHQSWRKLSSSSMSKIMHVEGDKKLVPIDVKNDELDGRQLFDKNDDRQA